MTLQNRVHLGALYESLLSLVRFWTQGPKLGIQIGPSGNWEPNKRPAETLCGLPKMDREPQKPTISQALFFFRTAFLGNLHKQHLKTKQHFIIRKAHSFPYKAHSHGFFPIKKLGESLKKSFKTAF